MESHFSKEQFDSNYPDGIEDHFWSLARSRILAKELRKIIKPGSVVLDVGCGRGVVVKYLRNNGINCSGIEPAKARPLAGIGKHIRFGKSAAELTRYERSRYDIILLLDVIEHIREPISFLRALMNSFPNLAYVIITVPACPELWSKYDEFYGHHRRYTAEMIQDLAIQLGVELAWRGYFFHALYIPMRILSGIRCRTSVRQTRAPHGILKWVHKLLSHGFVCEHGLLPGNVPGTSIIAVFALGKHAATDQDILFSSSD